MVRNKGNQCALIAVMMQLRHDPVFLKYVLGVKRQHDNDVEQQKAHPGVGRQEGKCWVLQGSFGEKFLTGVGGLKDGGQVDAAEVWGAILEELSGPAVEAATGKTKSHVQCEHGLTRQGPCEEFKLLDLPMRPLGKGGGDGAGGAEGGMSAPSVPGLLRKMFESGKPSDACKAQACTNRAGKDGETGSKWIDQLPSGHVYLHLPRSYYDWDSRATSKLDFLVDIPVELDMGEFTREKGAAMYDLDGVVHHSTSDATGQSGHYYSYVRTGDDTWRLFNEKVKDVASGEVLTAQAVILSYARRG